MTLPAQEDWREVGPRAASFGKERSYATRYRLVFKATPGIKHRQPDPWELIAYVRPLFLPYWPTDPPARLSTINFQQMANSLRSWDVDVSFTTDAQSQQASEDDDPLATRVTRRQRWGNKTEYTLIDRFGNPMCTTAGELYDPYAIDKGLPTLMLTWNAMTYDRVTAAAYRNATNSDPFYGFDPHTARVTDLEVEERQTSRGVYYYNHAASIEFDVSGRKRKTYNAGFYVKDANDETKKTRILDKNGEPRETPAFINQEGTEELVIDMSIPPEERPKPIEQTWEVLKAIPFGNFFPPP